MLKSYMAHRDRYAIFHLILKVLQETGRIDDDPRLVDGSPAEDGCRVGSAKDDLPTVISVLPGEKTRCWSDDFGSRVFSFVDPVLDLPTGGHRHLFCFVSIKIPEFEFYQP